MQQNTACNFWPSNNVNHIIITLVIILNFVVQKINIICSSFVILAIVKNWNLLKITIVVALIEISIIFIISNTRILGIQYNCIKLHINVEKKRNLEKKIKYLLTYIIHIHNFHLNKYEYKKPIFY